MAIKVCKTPHRSPQNAEKPNNSNTVRDRDTDSIQHFYEIEVWLSESVTILVVMERNMSEALRCSTGNAEKKAS